MQSRLEVLNVSLAVVGQKEASAAISWGYRYSNFLWSQNTLAHYLHLANRPHMLMVFTVCEDLHIVSVPFGTAQPCSITTKIHSSHLLKLVTHNLYNYHLLKCVNFTWWQNYSSSVFLTILWFGRYYLKCSWKMLIFL